MRTKLTKNQRDALAYEVIDAVVYVLAARQEDNALGGTDDELNDVPWGTIATQLAIWMKDLPTTSWNLDLPRVWEGETWEDTSETGSLIAMTGSPTRLRLARKSTPSSDE